ncbi:unnamed protein product [Nippostrongylus brasiliensis]|uniref:EB domain-containing protein n=1 Tax=Nippostrongylus brasiliensis TaxID=27835 RepID=A0A0N4YX65_NIPBR|nr:unnamed protein product [Nippostrongylus brasiliensis]
MHKFLQVKQNICCGEGDLSKKEKSDRKTERPKGTGSVKAGYCPAVMTPYLLNGKPKSCASSSCPYGFQCRYSTSKMNYYCCSTILTKSAVQRTVGGCKHGSVLLYPSTQEPVQCDHQMRSCPTGYVCLPHSVTKLTRVRPVKRLAVECANNLETDPALAMGFWLINYLDTVVSIIVAAVEISKGSLYHFPSSPRE